MSELKMFEGYRYKRATRGFFNPALRSVVSLVELENIFQERVVNPNRLENPKKYEDYSFMVVGASLNSPLNSWAGQIFGANGYENAQGNALWFGRFSCESDSKIFLPREKTVVTLKHGMPFYSQDIYTDCSDSNLRRLAEGQHNTDRIWPAASLTRTLVSDVPVIELMSCIGSNFSRQFLSEDKLRV